MKLFKSFCSAIGYLYLVSGFVIALGSGMDDKMSNQNQIYSMIYVIVWFIIFMTIVIYKSDNVKE